MLSPEVRANMEALLAKAEAGLAALPKFDYQHRAPYDAAVADLVREIEAAGARIRDRSTWVEIKAAGSRSTSTGGTAAAIRNWCEVARARLGKETA